MKEKKKIKVTIMIKKLKVQKSVKILTLDPNSIFGVQEQLKNVFIKMTNKNT